MQLQEPNPRLNQEMKSRNFWRGSSPIHVLLLNRPKSRMEMNEGKKRFSMDFFQEFIVKSFPVFN